uniref:Reverse transcriptase domain-containing protein n=1 Tax=Ascaris lumbricoides TaxID=6252 RepID=A0A0M3ILE6_ASCLU
MQPTSRERRPNKRKQTGSRLRATVEEVAKLEISHKRARVHGPKKYFFGWNIWAAIKGRVLLVQSYLCAILFEKERVASEHKRKKARGEESAKKKRLKTNTMDKNRKKKSPENGGKRKTQDKRAKVGDTGVVAPESAEAGFVENDEHYVEYQVCLEL